MDAFGLFVLPGMEHILGGYDHILFLAALLLAGGTLKELGGVISAFTISHSIALVLCAAGVLTVPSIVVESLIAASILYVGIENVVGRKAGRRWIVAAIFGLVHGAGFSGHLLGLLQGAGAEAWGAIFGFTVGIEIGQVLIIILALPLVALARRYGREESISLEVSRVIAAIGGFLLIARAFGIMAA